MKHLVFLLTLLIAIISVNIAYADSRLDKCEPYRNFIEAILKEEGVSTNYFYLAVCESTCKVKESNKGARGFFQVMRPIYKFYKPDNCTMEDIDDIRCNTIAAARYIKHLNKRFGHISTIVKAYNRGGTNLIRKGTTTEANNLSHCVMKYINQANK